MVRKGGHLSAATKAKISASLKAHYRGRKRTPAKDGPAKFGFSGLSVQSQENIVRGARRRADKAYAELMKPRGDRYGNMGEGTRRNLERARRANTEAQKYADSMWYASHLGKAAGMADSHESAQRYAAEARKAHSTNPTYSPPGPSTPHARKSLPTTGNPTPAKKVTGTRPTRQGNPRIGRIDGRSTTPKFGREVLAEGKKPKRTLTAAQKAAKAERARKRRAAKKRG